MPTRTQILYATPRCPRIRERAYVEGQPGQPVVCNEPMISSPELPFQRSHWRCPHGHTITWTELVRSQTCPVLEAA